MSDTVVRVPIRGAADEAAFGSYLSRFLNALADEAVRLAEALDAPFLMVRNEPQLDGDLRILTFQQAGAARAFASGWRRLQAAPSA